MIKVKNAIEKLDEIFEKYNFLFLVPVLALFLYSRFQYLGEISYYMHIDELQEAYDALCLAHFGTTGSGNAASVYMSGSGHNALFILLSALIMKVKGGLFSLKLFRLLSVAAGLFGAAFSYLTVMELTGKKKYAFLEAIIVTCLPIYFISQRAGVEDYLFLEIVPAAYFFLLKGLSSGKRVLYIISGILFGLILLTSESTYFIVPVFLAASAVYIIVMKKADIKSIAALCIPVIVFAVLLLIFGHGSAKLGFSNAVANIKNIKALFWDDLHPFNISSTFGTVFIFSIPLLITGVIVSIAETISCIRRKEYTPGILLWIFALTVIICSLFTEGADLQSGNSLFFAISLLLADGMIYVSKNLKYTFIIEIAVYLICFRIFTYYYFENFNSEVNNSTDHEIGTVVDKSVGEAVKSALKLLPGKEISIITDDFEGRNLMIALYADASPADYQAFKDQDSFSFGIVRVNSGEEPGSNPATVYIIDQAEHQDMIDSLTAQGWGYVYLKEYTICFMQ
ncbi:MAG: glycosyltransferase family 39 protein [Lachnospiraceae bacterium]|nr:glycosyltransferase family 39 protein [Lachnospiraceae bacterium]